MRNELTKSIHKHVKETIYFINKVIDGNGKVFVVW